MNIHFLQEIEGITILSSGQIFVESWGPDLLINPQDFGGVEVLSSEVATATIGPWLGTNGCGKYKIFCIRTNILVQFKDLPSIVRQINAKLMEPVTEAEVIHLPSQVSQSEAKAA